MEGILIGLLLYFGGRWLVKIAGPNPHLCPACRKVYRGEWCPNCEAERDINPHEIDVIATIYRSPEGEKPVSFFNHEL